MNRAVSTVYNAAASALAPLLRLMDAETAHRLAIRALGAGLVGTTSRQDDPALSVHAMGLTFSNPIGLAAGFDKDAEAIVPLMKLGFGFVEAGTVTPLPQVGNPHPRLFRLVKDRAVINRMGFNNAGVARYCARLETLPRLPRPLGANVGINKDGAIPERDYPALVRAVAPSVNYITINVSSPNTPGLRDLQDKRWLSDILRAVAREVPVRPPLLIKLAPDLGADVLEGIVEVAIEEGAAGLIMGNTTTDRPPGLRSGHAAQAGGLSGAPLFARSTEMLMQVSRLARGRLVLVGCGGAQTGADVLTKIKAGASLVQVYTGFAYGGPAFIPTVKRQLGEALRQEGFASVGEAVGAAL